MSKDNQQKDGPGGLVEAHGFNNVMKAFLAVRPKPTPRKQEGPKNGKAPKKSE